jgi:hypothetical protein
MLICSAILAATALSGCRVAVADRAGSPVWVPASSRPMPSGFSDSKAWSAKVTWSRSALVRAGVPATWSQDTPIGAQYSASPGFGLVAVTGDVVVMTTFAASPKDARAPRTPVTLQFRNARTGDPLASKSLETDVFGGLRADTLDGKPVVEVRYATGPVTETTGFVSTVFDTSAHQLWTSAGQRVTSTAVEGGLQLLGTTNGLLSHGYLIRGNPGQGTWNAGASYDVLDTTGKVIMNIPYHAFFDPANPTKVNSVNGLQLVDGYAVVDHSDTSLAGSSLPAQLGFRFTVYDLAQGGKKVADAPVSIPVVPSNVHDWPRAVAACGSKIVLTWETGSTHSPTDSAIQIAVLDLRTGRTTPPVALVTRLPNYGPIMDALSDPACTTMLIYGGGIPTTVPTFAINLADATVLWRTDRQDHYLSLHNGVTYALRWSDPSPVGSPHPVPQVGRLVSIAPDGGTLGSGLAVAPLAFTADGSPVFAEMSQPSVCEPRPPSPTASSPSGATGRPVTGPPWPTSCDMTVWVGRATR